ncbi:MAG: exosortase [Planctomycetota bacterium]|jgi:exosortase
MPESLQQQSTERSQIKAVILVGPLDFGRCPVATRLHRALWPVVDKPVLQRLIEHISSQGVNKFVICCDGDSGQIRRSLTISDSMEMEFLDELLPRGTGGCVLDAARTGIDELLFVFGASMLIPPDIGTMADAHRRSGADMTIMFGGNNGPAGEMAEGYICGPSILENIPQAGYCDIKEGLIPELVQTGKTIHAAKIPSHIGSFRSWREYLAGTGDFLENVRKGEIVLAGHERYNSQDVWIGPAAQVDSSARIFGPVIISEGATISENVVIFGPTIIGQNVVVGKGSLVAGSVLWDGGRVGIDCEIRRCLLSYDVVVGRGKDIEDKLVIRKKALLADRSPKVLNLINKDVGRLESFLQPALGKIKERLPDYVQTGQFQKQALMWLGAVILLLTVIWTYWKPTVADLWTIWLRSDEYSSGMLVPLIAAYIVWLRRKDLASCSIRPSIWGLFALVGAQALRFFGLFFMYGSAERISLVLTIAALVLLLFGWRLFWKVSSVLAFLFLMLPLPNRIQMAVTLPLQDWATASAVFCLETLGYEVIREGNIINLNGTMVAVVEACNGLRMVTAFFVISGLVVLLVQRRWWEKLIILLSAIPIGLVCNTLRLTVTAIAFTKLDAQHWEMAFHDYGGLAMMPLAIGIVVFELWLLSNLVKESESGDKQTAMNLAR